MRLFKALSMVGILLLASACKTGEVRDDVPARIVDQTLEGRAELQRIVSDALNGRKVTIADDALSNDSLLIIEASQLTGRDLGRPDLFRMVLNGSTCILVHLGSDARHELSDTNCAAE